MDFKVGNKVIVKVGKRWTQDCQRAFYNVKGEIIEKNPRDFQEFLVKMELPEDWKSGDTWWIHEYEMKLQ